MTIFLRLKDRFHRSGALRILEEWKALADEVWKALTLTRFYVVTTLDELSLTQADEIARDIEGMGLSIAGRIYNRCDPDRLEATDAVLSVPELGGSALTIVEKMEPYAAELMASTAP